MKKELFVELVIAVSVFTLPQKSLQVTSKSAILTGPLQRKIICWHLIDKCKLVNANNTSQCDELGSLCFDRTKICVVMERFCRDATNDEEGCEAGVKKCCENIVKQILSTA
ncbi:hypothetical protein Tcan_13385 [Toxocara canis]|uniref:Uncharacterized protein n=1 Tax=Toxocara canis TaxID=6265 RepID=A0A0B2V1D9_TOXCA|nr:hypothetical protein Tcan_13385 [Toxocara canis]